MRFLVTADWQIGTKFGAFDDADAVILGEARFDTVKRIAHLASDLAVDAVLVAGDVFDQQTVSDKIILRLFQSLALFAGPWVLIPGNHDAAIAGSVWSRAQRLHCIPPNVHVLLTPQAFVLNDACSILAAPLTQRHTYDDVTAFFDTVPTPAHHLRIGLAHGSVTGRLPDSIDATNPIAADRADRAKLDFLALGDWHGALPVGERTWYPGTPETDRFRNNRSGLVLEVSIDAPGAAPSVTEHPTSRYRWESWSAALAVTTDLDLLEERLRTIGEFAVVHLAVSGAVDLSGARRLDQAIERAASVARALRVDRTGLQLTPTSADLDSLGASGGYLANVVNQLRALQDDPTRGSVATEALLLLASCQASAEDRA